MQYKQLSNNIQIPYLGFGTWDVRGKEGLNVLLNAIHVGYRLIDTAHMYDNEEIVGKAIKESKVPREEFFLTTKLDRTFNSYEKAKQGIQNALTTLHVDYIDLLLLHEPYPQVEQMYQALIEAYEEGSIRAIGISNFNEERYLKFIKQCSILPMVNQVESHVYYPQLELKDTLKKHGTFMQSWGSFTEGQRDIFREERLIEIGRKYQKSAGQVALRYLVQNGIGVIPKSSHIERMEENFNIFDFELDKEDLSLIKQLDEKHSLFNWYSNKRMWY